MYTKLHEDIVNEQVAIQCVIVLLDLLREFWSKIAYSKLCDVCLKSPLCYSNMSLES